MPQRRLQLVHVAAEDRQRRSGQTGQAVSGYATFYWRGSGFTKVLPGELDLAELWGGASGFGNVSEVFLSAGLLQKVVVKPMVEFYLDQGTTNHPRRVSGFVALNGASGDFFTFGFFGKRYS